jgi:TonB-linked SusC/RagA family outer membrane protein
MINTKFKLKTNKIMSRKLNTILILIVLNLFSCYAVFAQKTGVSGTVTDKTGNTVPGVTIVEKGTSNGTVADSDGKYTIQVTGSSSVLIYSFIGLKPQEIEVGQKRVINVVLEEDMVLMDEVVVVGYGTQKRGNVTGSISSVNPKVIKERPITNIEEALQGQVPGLSISSTGGQPGAATKMNIRGISSVSGSSQPLIVVDGFPLNEISTSGGGGLEGYSAQMSSFSYINPDDIESIEVLKDASATAIYGNRGANGVIMITTKKGRKGEAGITYNGYYGVQEMKKRIDVMDFSEYALYQQTVNPTNRLFTAPDGSAYSFPDADDMNIDWQDEIYRRGIVQNHSISVQGKTEKTSYAISGLYNQNKSVLMETNFQKFSNRASIDHNFSDKLMVGANLNISKIINNGVPTDGREGTAAGVVISALFENPFRMDNNTQARFRRAGVPQSILDSYVAGHLSNPDNVAENTKLDKTINRSIANFYANYQFIDWLSFRTTLGADIYNLKDQQFYSKVTPWGQLNNGVATAASVNATNYVNENYFTFAKNFKKHNLNVLSGVSFQQNKSEYYRTEGRDFQNEQLGYNSLQGAAEFLSSSSVDELFMVSFLARANYSFDDRFLATVSYRADGTSRFINDKWGDFYSGALGWNMKKESFLADSRIISELKVRTSIGQVGNANVPIQGALLDQQYSNYTFNGNFVNGISPQNLENEDLTWETTTQYNAGIDFGIFNNTFSFTADYFIKNTSDLLMLTPVTISTGFSEGWFNVGEIQNKGFELSATYDLITTSGFGWNSKLNLTTMQNEIKKLGNDGEPIYIDVNFDAICTDEMILQVGGSVNDLYGYQTDGIYLPEDFNPDGSLKEGVASSGAGEKPGDIKYKDLKEDGVIDGFDRTVLGNTTPKIFGSWNNSLLFKGITFDVLLQYSFGNKVLNATNTRISSFSGSGDNQTSNWLDRWSEENPTSQQYARVPSLRPADYLVEDASFVRLQTLRLGYNLPSKWISVLKIKNAKVYMEANNLAVFTNYSGYDPEITSNQVDWRYPFIQGIDYGGFPRATTFITGVNIGF